VRDIVRSLQLLKEHLAIEKIHTCIGGSLGGQQALEWAILEPGLIEHLVLLATNAVHSPWGIAFNESQRMAIASDQSWNSNNDNAGAAGMRAARSVALLSYRNYNTYQNSQEEVRGEKLESYKAASYQQYQGEKLEKRFNAFSYWSLTRTMDSHDVGRNRTSVKRGLSQIRSRTLVIGIGSDILFPVSEQQFLAENIPDAVFQRIDSLYGHDGFLIECKQIEERIKSFYTKNLKQISHEHSI
jgi:homoserine O-acetyltransferase/O-succinyltransferase